MKTLLQDIGWLLLIGLTLPITLLVALAGLVIVVCRHVYWWARGNTTAASRPSRAGRWFQRAPRPASAARPLSDAAAAALKPPVKPTAAVHP